MVKKTIGIILLVIGGIFGIILLASGLVWPHIIGPTTLVAIGVILLTVKRKAGTQE
jgi:hypothetical protein